MSRKNRNKPRPFSAEAAAKGRDKPPERQKAAAIPQTAVPGEGIGRRGCVILVSALVLIAAGYFFLKKTDPAGGDVYAVLSALFLLAGYLLVPAALRG